MATSYSNNGGTGERRMEIVVTSNIVSSVPDLGAQNLYSADQLGVFVDGLTSGSIGNGNPGREFGGNNVGQDRNLTFDFGPSATIVIDEIKIYSSATASFGTWTFDGSNDGSGWTTIGASFTLQPASGSQTIARTNSTAYRYYRIHTTNMTNGGGGTGSWYEVELKLEDTTPQTSRCSWFNTGGKGDRNSFVTPTTTLTFSSGVIANVIDGSYTNNSSDAVTLNAGLSTKDITFDFGSGISVVIDTIGLWTAAGPAATDGTWKLQGSPNASSWTDLESASDLFATTNGYKLTKRTVANTTGYRYYRLLQTSGTTSAAPIITEIEFRISGYANVNAKDFKLSGYGVIAPIAAHDYKLSGYGIVAPITARDFKLSGYAVIKPVVASGNQPVLIVIAG